MKKSRLLYGAGIFIALLVGISLGKLVSRPDAPPVSRATPTPERSAPALAFVRDAWGVVELAATDGVFSKLEQGKTLSAGSRVRTNARSRTVIMLRGAGRIVVSEESELHIEDASVDAAGKVTALRIRVVRGSLRAESAGDGDARLDVDIGGGRVVELAQGGRVLVSPGSVESEFLVSFLEADGFVRDASGGRERVPREHGVALAANGSGPAKAVRLPAAPRPAVEEERREVFTGSEPDAKVAFRFTKEKERVRLAVGVDPEMTDVVAEGIGRGSVALEKPLAPGDYYWTAQSISDTTNLVGPPSRPRKLAVVAGDAPPAKDERPTSRVVVESGRASVYFTGEPPEVGIEWPGLSDAAGWNVRIGRDKALVKLEVDAQTAESRWTAGGLPAGTWHWRAKKDATSHSGTFVLKAVPGTLQRDVRTNRVSEDFNAATVVFQREAPAIEFAWKPDARAAGYRLVVARGDDFAKPVATRDTRETSARLAAGTLRDGAYRWRTERLLADGSILYPGKARSLELNFDNEVPGVEISSPNAGAIVTSGDVLVAGLARPGMNVEVNGSSVAVDREGRFSVRMPVDPADPRLVFLARRGGQTAWYVREVRWAAAAAP